MQKREVPVKILTGSRRFGELSGETDPLATTHLYLILRVGGKQLPSRIKLRSIRKQPINSARAAFALCGTKF